MIIRFNQNRVRKDDFSEYECSVKMTVSSDNALKDFVNHFLENLHKIAQIERNFKVQRVQQKWVVWVWNDSNVKSIFTKLKLNNKQWNLAILDQYMDFKKNVAEPVSLYYKKSVKENYRSFDDTSEFFQL